MRVVTVVEHPLSCVCGAIDLAYTLKSAAAIMLQAQYVEGKPKRHRYVFMTPGHGGRNFSPITQVQHG